MREVFARLAAAFSSAGNTGSLGANNSAMTSSGNSSGTNNPVSLCTNGTCSQSNTSGASGSGSSGVRTQLNMNGGSGDGTNAAAVAQLNPSVASKIPTGPQKKMNIWLTGFSFQDNTPPGSSIVSHPIVHQKAGGTGTFTDPITVASPGSKDNTEFKPGTMFYLPTVQRYVIVEDSGASPPPSGTDGHLDLWVAGEGDTKTQSDQCMNKLTKVGVDAIMNPPPNEKVLAGPITQGGKCNLPSNLDSSG